MFGYIFWFNAGEVNNKFSEFVQAVFRMIESVHGPTIVEYWKKVIVHNFTILD
jgi:hypothetical protein